MGPLEGYKQILTENRVGQASDRFIAAEQILQNIKTTKVFGKEGFFLNKFSLASKYKISAQINALEDNDADAVYSPWAKFEFNGKSVKPDGPILQTKPLPGSKFLYALLHQWATVLQTFLFKKDFLDQIGPFKTDVNYLEDIDYFVQSSAMPKSYSNKAPLHFTATTPTTSFPKPWKARRAGAKMKRSFSILSCTT